MVFLYSVLRKNSLVRACEETFRIVVFDTLECKGDGGLLGEPSSRRSVVSGSLCVAPMLVSCASATPPPASFRMPLES